MEPRPASPPLPPGARLAEEIRRFVLDSPDNRVRGGDGPYFDDVLVGFAAAADPLFADYKKIIGAFHATPQEVLAHAHGPDARARTVVCWSLSIARAVRLANRREARLPAREWALTRGLGEQLNSALRRHVVAHLEGLGHRAVAPLLAPDWQQLSSTPVGIASTWSERHAAYAAGLGTFSLNDGLITARGIAHRVGSVVTDLWLEPTPRRAAHHRENCLTFRGAACAVCARRCPAGAITLEGHDKEKCQAYVQGTRREWQSLGLKEVGCGLCQTKVPCEERIPPEPRAAGRRA